MVVVDEHRVAGPDGTAVADHLLPHRVRGDPFELDRLIAHVASIRPSGREVRRAGIADRGHRLAAAVKRPAAAPPSVAARLDP